MNNAFPVEPAPVAVPVSSAGNAIKLVQLARSLCLKASYHPAGGDACLLGYVPVTHTVWVIGDAREINYLQIQSMKLESQP